MILFDGFHSSLLVESQGGVGIDIIVLGICCACGCPGVSHEKDVTPHYALIGVQYCEIGLKELASRSASFIHSLSGNQLVLLIGSSSHDPVWGNLQADHRYSLSKY